MESRLEVLGNEIEKIVNTIDLQKEIKRLQKEKAVYQAQSRMLDHFVSVARASADQKMINATLQKTLEVAIELTEAEKGSLFLLDENGVVTESILTRTQASFEERNQLIGTVMDQGLAGWVRCHCNLTTDNCKSTYISDTEKDPRWLTLPGQPYEVRSALVVPIVRKGVLFGLLTLIHSRPGRFGNESIELIEMTAVQIGVILENATLYAKLEESFHRIAQAKHKIEIYSAALDLEMEKGRMIQRDFLPSEIPPVSGWEIEAFLYPAIRVSGDFYDVFELSYSRLGLVIADVCDKGVGAAFFMALFRSLIRVYTLGSQPSGSLPDHPVPIGQPLQAIHDTNSYIVRHHSEMGMFATIFFSILNVKSGRLTYVNAGHEPPVVLTSKGKIIMLPPTGPAVGLIPEIDLISRQIQLDPGDTLIAFTDGVTEATSPANKIRGRKQLYFDLCKPFSSAGEIIDHIKSETFKHIGHAPQHDDITLLCVRRKTETSSANSSKDPHTG
jgi:phosphoserine phosphatase RsbU/P